MKNYPLYEVRQITDLKEMLDSSCKIYAAKPAYLSKTNPESDYIPISYTQLKKDVDAFGTALIDMGMKGKRIAVMGENRYEWSISYLAVMNGAGVVVPIDKELPANEIEGILKRLNISLFIYSDKIEEIRSMKANLEIVEHFVKMGAKEDENGHLGFWNIVEKGRELVKKGNRTFLDAKIDPDAVSILLLTSATTDVSKVVMLTQRNIAENIMAMNRAVDINEKDTFLSILPIHHVYECTCGFLTPLFKGSTIAYCDGLKYVVKNLAESKTTILLAVPLVVEMMYKKVFEAAEKKGIKKKLLTGIKISNFLMKLGIDVRKKLFHEVQASFGGHMRLIVSGAAAIDPAVSTGFRSLGLHVIQGYGLTECSPILGVNREFYYKDAAAGFPLDNIRIKIDNPDENGVGEILAQGPSVFKGYYDNDEATTKAFRDGWFCTGDLGKQDKEGFIYITGRKKNVIVTKNGKNIFPEEIEMLLGKSPFVLESVVYGKRSDSDSDEIITAVIVPNLDNIKEVTGNPDITNDEIYDLIKKEVKEINNKLTTYKYVKEIELRDIEFPKTTTKKIKRYVK